MDKNNYKNEFNMDINKNSGCLGKRTSTFFGILITLAGVLLLAFNMGWVDSSLREVIFSWQIIFVIFTIYYAIKRELFTTFIFAILSVFFFLPKLAEVYPDVFPWIDYNFRRNLFPIALILVGICIIFEIFFEKTRIFGVFFEKNRKIRNWGKSRKNFFGGASGTAETDGVYARSVIFGGAEDIFLEPVFSGGTIVAIFGDVELDLRKTTLPEGNTNLDIDVIFGSVDLYIPGSWKVENKMNYIFGGVDESRKKQSYEIEIDPSRRLIITGNVIFGGAEILYYGNI